MSRIVGGLLLLSCLLVTQLLWTQPLWAQPTEGATKSQLEPEGEVTADKNKNTRHLYLEANRLFDDGFYLDAIRKYTIVVDKEPSTLQAVYAHLRLAQANEKLEKWDEAEINYRRVTILQPYGERSHLIYYNLIRVQYEQTLAGFFRRKTNVSRNIKPYKNIVQDAERFFLIYPNSSYQGSVTDYYNRARHILAGHEQLVADFYFKRHQYAAAANRYLFLLKNYPEYPQKRKVLAKLINSYQLGQQEHRAKEWEPVLKRLKISAANAKS